MPQSLTNSLTYSPSFTYMHAYIHTYTHTYIRTYTHTYIHIYLSASTYLFIHACVWLTSRLPHTMQKVRTCTIDVQNMSTSAATQISDLVCAYACTRQKYVGLLIHTVVTQIAERERETFGVIRGETYAFSRSSKCPYEQRGGPCGRGVSQPPHVPGKKRAF